ncbi:lysosomal acid glucosylceramidase isoform X2 [Linepithema humile]|uniref:lysosomal acid glucosylceramidase isoform X2 n=1 Tax=Linepithema humile TaxID=83485 RepID=UPI000623B632|nr:PREDICTED: glucosylceramidase-like isoform X2 [Linepithema humile]
MIIRLASTHCLHYSKMLRAVIILFAAFVAVESYACVPRSVGPDAIVCVCNSTYCDTIDNPQLQANQFQLYTSTKSGQRLQLTIANLSNEPTKGKLFIVNSREKHQTIHGFGGAMTDAAALNIRTLSNATQQKLLESYFGVNGIGYTHVRIPIAGTDFSTRPYTYDDVPGDITLSNFSLVEEDDYKIEYINQIKNMMPIPESLRIFTTSWSAPPWMKTSNKITWGFLKRIYYQTYANYIRKFFDAYKERGIEIWGMTPGNEPIDGFLPFFSFNAMGWGPKTVAHWSTYYLIPTLSKAGYNPVYIALDDQRFELPWYVDLMFKNEETKKLFSGVAFHWYADSFFSPLRLTETHNKYLDKFILMTEACVGSFPFEKKVDMGSWERGERYLSDIIENLSHWVAGWIDWNIALDKNGAPNWAQNFVDSPIIVMPENDEFYKQPMFYALSHVSKFVPRNSSRISLTAFNDIKDVKQAAFLTPDQRIVVVLINKGDEPVDVAIKDKYTDKFTITAQLPGKSFSTLQYLAPK